MRLLAEFGGASEFPDGKGGHRRRGDSVERRTDTSIGPTRLRQNQRTAARHYGNTTRPVDDRGGRTAGMTDTKLLDALKKIRPRRDGLLGRTCTDEVPSVMA